MALSRIALAFPLMLSVAFFPAFLPSSVFAEDAVVTAGAVEGEKSPSQSLETSGPLVSTAPEPVSSNNAASRCAKVTEENKLLPAFYGHGPAVATFENDVLVVTSEAGTLQLSGGLAPLVKIEIPLAGELNLNGVKIARHVRFVHSSAEGKTGVVIVPVQEGAARPVIDIFLRLKGAQVHVDLAELLPVNRTAVAFEGCENLGADAAFLLVSPITITADEWAALMAAGTP